MKYKTFQGLILALFILSLFLGFQLFNIFQNSRAIPKTETSLAAQNSQNTQNDNQQDELKLIEQTTWKDLSAEEQQNLQGIVHKLAEETNQISLAANCQVTPYVVKVSSKEILKIKNTDSVLHKINFINNTSLDAKSQAESSFMISKLQKGLNRYGCDGKASGYIIVTD